MIKFNRNTVDRRRSSVAAGMWSRTLQFSLTLADRSKSATLPPKTARSPSVERFVGVTTSVSVTDERRRQRPSVSAHNTVTVLIIPVFQVYRT